ncbi:zeta toxin family protein [Streptomyces sp. NPDC102381]|uniref:zeta toxin family protein n=1 Tax=Streptomyces sp. NPDC102381 TaxID=3366164 RepID=UPI00380E048B
MRDADITPVVLSEHDHQEVLMSRILPRWTGHAVSQDRPVTILVGGAPGSGKSTACQVLQQILDRRGGAVLIGRDLYKDAHPTYRTLLQDDECTAGVRVRPDVLRWQTEVEEYVCARRFDAVVEAPVVDPEQVRAHRRVGRRVEVVVVAEAEAVTQLSVLDRYLDVGRYVSWENQDQVLRTLLQSLRTIETEQVASRVMVLRRDLEVLYDSETAAEMGAHRALRAALERPWTAPETWTFQRQIAGLEQRLHPVQSTPERRLLVAGGLKRAEALAEPVRRIARPLTVPPGVDYHRLSADEHAFIYDELIVPLYLSNIAPHEQPMTLYLVGPQGSGKSHTAHTLHQVLRARRPTRIEGGVFKSMHPDYRRLLEEDPRTASARIRPDYRRWQAKAEQRVREHRGDLLIEIAPDDLDHFLDSARRDRAAGRRVEVIALGMRAADSRLGIATRAAGVARIGGTPRFTESTAHDRTFALLADVVRAAEQMPDLVDSVSVVGRDLTARYRNTRRPDGTWEEAPRGGDVVENEQHRPYTPSEAARFLATLRQVQAELPRFRQDLVEIAALARPLMPEHLRPRALTLTIPVTALPLPRFAAAYWPLNSLSRAA